MPQSVDKIREAVQKENPGMSESRTWAIATAAKKRQLGIRGKTTWAEIAKKEKSAGPILRYGIEKMKEVVKGKKKPDSLIKDKLAGIVARHFRRKVEDVGRGVAGQDSRYTKGGHPIKKKGTGWWKPVAGAFGGAALGLGAGYAAHKAGLSGMAIPAGAAVGGAGGALGGEYWKAKTAQSPVSFPELLKGLKTTKTLKTSEKGDTDPSTESSEVRSDEEMETLSKQSALRKMAKAVSSGTVRITSTPKSMATGGEVRSVEMSSKDFGQMSSAYADALRQNYPAMPKAQIHDAALATARDAVRRVAFREKPSYKFGQDIPPDLSIGKGGGKKSSGWWKTLVGALGGAGLGAGAGYAAHKAGLSPKAILAGTAVGGAGGLVGGEYWKAKTALQKFARTAKWESQPTFAARHPGWTTAGGALLGHTVGTLPGNVASFAGVKPEVALPLAIGGGLAGAIGGGYLGYRHAKKRQQQYLKGSPEGKTILEKQSAFQEAFFDELSKIAQGVSVGQYIKGGLQKAVKAIPKPKLPASIPKPKLPGISGGLKPIRF